MLGFEFGDLGRGGGKLGLSILKRLGKCRSLLLLSKLLNVNPSKLFGLAIELSL